MESTQTKMIELEKKIDTLERRISLLMLMSAISVLLGLAKLYMQSQGQSGNNTNAVNIGAQSAASPQRDFLDTDEVGKREGVTSRTVLTWIEQGRIEPQPTRDGRAWNISANYRILPLLTANDGNE